MIGAKSRRVAYSVIAVWVVSFGLSIAPAASAGDSVYWSNANPGKRISFANLDGSGGGDLTTTGATVNAPTGVATTPPRDGSTGMPGIVVGIEGSLPASRKYAHVGRLAHAGSRGA
jgi:hypothetical protein